MEDKDRLKRGFQLALGATIFQIFLTLLFYFLYTTLRTPLLLTGTFHLGIGIPIFSLLFLLFHQRYKEILEKEEVEELVRREGRIFGDEEAGFLISNLRLKQIEKWVIPLATLILSILLIYTPLKIVFQFHGKELIYEAIPVIPFLLIGLTFLIFLFSRYLLGVSKEKPYKDLRIIGSYLGVNALFTFLIAISIGLTGVELPRVEVFVFYLLIFLLIATGIEYTLNIVASFYRSKKAEKRLPLNSKILYLLSTPDEVIPSFSKIIDYQFGFRITQTWFYQFISSRIIPLVIGLFSFLYLLTCIVIVGPHQRAFIEFLGRPVENGKVFGPGFYFKFPYPFGKARIHDVERVKSIRIGAIGEVGPHYLWTERHFEEEFNWIVPSREIVTLPDSVPSDIVPVNLLAVIMHIYYQIHPEGLFDYVYRHSHPENLLKNVVHNEFSKMVMGTDFFQIMNVGRLSLAETLKERIQEEVERHKLGIKILLVSMEGIHPPVEVAESFSDVVGAMERKEAFILDAEAHQRRELALATHTASKIKIEAESYKEGRILESEAREEAFKKNLEAFNQNPRIFKYRRYLKTLEESLIHPKKYIIISPETGREVTILNLERGVLPDILTLGLEAERGRR